MDAEFFVDSVLEKHLIPFVAKKFPDGHRFMQDNDTKHTSKHAKQYYKPAGIKWWPIPPESPDLNPIELMWHEMKHVLRTTVKPTTNCWYKASLFFGSLEYLSWSVKTTSII